MCAEVTAPQLGDTEHVSSWTIDNFKHTQTTATGKTCLCFYTTAGANAETTLLQLKRCWHPRDCAYSSESKCANIFFTPPVLIFTKTVE